MVLTTFEDSFGDFAWKAYNDSFEMALIGNNVKAISNPFHRKACTF